MTGFLNLCLLLMMMVSPLVQAQTYEQLQALNMVHWINNATNGYKITGSQFYYMDQSAGRLVTKYNQQVDKIKQHHHLENKTLRSSLSEQQKNTLCGAYFVSASVEFFAWIEKHHTPTQGYDIVLRGQKDLDQDGQTDAQIILYDYKLIARSRSAITSESAIASAKTLLQQWTALLQCETSYNDTLRLIRKHINNELFGSSVKSTLASWFQIVPNIDIRNQYFQEEIPFDDEDLSIQMIAAATIEFMQASLGLSTYKD